jgi:hypothetical protein
MATYKLLKNLENGMGCVLRDGKDSIPFAQDNTDYAQFKKAVAEGAELQDADGNVMSSEAAQAFIATLP